MEKLKSMKEMLMCCAEGQMTHLDSVDAQELGAVIDMIKDLEEAIYYCTIVEAMEEKEEEKEKHGKQEHHHYYTERYVHPEYYRNMDMGQGRMYFEDYNMNYANNGGGNGRRNYPSDYNMYYPGNYNMGTYASNSNSSGNCSNSSTSGSSRSFTEKEMPMMMRDQREGRSPMSRKTYMEAKEMHQPKTTQMKELEKYLQELSSDITEMIDGASPEEKQLLEKKINTLATKVSQA